MPQYHSGEYKTVPTHEVEESSGEARERNLSVSGEKIQQSQRAASPFNENDMAQRKRGKTLGVMALCCLTYYSVSGGPFGFESVVQAGGPFWALAGFAFGHSVFER